MRYTRLLAAVGLLLMPAALAAQGVAGGGQTPATGTAVVTPDVDSSNFFDFGYRGTFYGSGSDEAGYQRYRDLRNGPTLDVFRYANQTNTYWFTAQADHVGYRDQRYSASYDRYGKVKMSFEWNQIPLFYSVDTATLYTTESPGVLRMDDAIQSGLQNKTLTLANAVTQAQPFELRQKRDVLDFRLIYSATRSLDLNLSVRNTTKTGEQPWAGTFGFSDAVELAAPLDTRTTDLGTGLEWTGKRGLVRLGYDGSFFRNSIPTLTWDNPLRVSDDPTLGPMQGRMALWPNSDTNTGSATGVLNLPYRSHALAYISIGNWTQNQALIPFTINSALAPIPLDRPTADVKAVVTAMAYSFTSRPIDPLWLSARYRSYDFDNRTPVFQVTNTVSYDTTPATFAEGGTSPFAYKRETFDADASLTPIRYTAFRVGYTREQVDQTFRTFDTTTENTVRLSADSTGLNWLTLRAVYEHGKRVGTGLDEQALDDIGEQTSLRQFDISDRISDRFSGIVLVTPVSSLSFNGMVSVGKEDRPGTEFGLRSNDNHGYSVGFDFVPRNAVSLGASYEYDKYATLQASRQANPGPQFDDPTRDWTTDGDDRTHTFTAGLDLIKVWPKTDIRFAYKFSHAQSTYVYGLAPNTTLPPVQQLPPVLNQFQRASVDMRYYITAHLAAGASYWYEDYKVNDFALGPETLTSLAQPSFLMLGYLYRPYTANTVMGRLTYLW